MLRRDWSLANAKREGGCRVCGKHPAELAHVINRARDERRGDVATVHPDSVAPLCKDHHRRYDARRLDLLPYLTVEEQVRAVADAGGLELARKRIVGRVL